jgi:hypothetical protein
MSWKEVKHELIKSIEEVERDEFGRVSVLKDKFSNYFGKKLYSNQELAEAKDLLQKLNSEIEKKSLSYSAEIESNIKNLQSFRTYLKNMQVVD